MYTVLARKYRPQYFSELVGQDHIVRALSNALKQERLHHAYLFSGTRGVGKTTLGRIIAKCLNCHQGITPEPCGQCPGCIDIDAAQAMDLIEIDAASNTKVEDTRILLDNVQYAPTRDRFKVYLIDEVHMLSGHSFNALLKTLEEPPEYVKFILATTDPQKLPATILSRCLQFNLKPIAEEIITEKLQSILQQEKIEAEYPALLSLATAAQGSLRDALSLLDQAIAYSGGNVLQQTDMQAMLGLIGEQTLYNLLDAVANQDASRTINNIQQLAQEGADFYQVSLELINLLQQLAQQQILPAEDATENLQQLAQQFDKETVQLFYQITLTGHRDLKLAPSERTGFTMLMLRMLAFSTTPDNVSLSPIESKTPVAEKPDSDQVKQPINPQLNWRTLIEKMKLTGVTQVLAQHCSLSHHNDRTMTLEIDQSHAALVTDKHQQRLQQAITKELGHSIGLTIEYNTPSQATPAQQQAAEKTAELNRAQEALNADPNIQLLQETFSAKLLADTITPQQGSQL